MRLATLLLVLLVLIPVLTNAQRLEEFHYFDIQGVFYDVFAMQDGSFAVCGLSSNYQTFVFKIARNGVIIWQYWTNGSLHSVIETDRSDILASGNADGGFGGVLLDSEGNRIWENSYGRNGRAFTVIELKSGEFVFNGQVGATTGYTVMTNREGEMIWERNEQVYSHFTSMRETENGLLMVGSKFVNRSYGWIQLLDFEGEIIWSRDYRNNFENDLNYSIDFTSLSTASNGQYVAYGTSEHPQWGRTVNIVLLIDLEGNVINKFQYNPGAGTSDRATCITRVGNNDYALVGYVYNANWETREYPSLISLDSNYDITNRNRFTEEIDRWGERRASNNRFHSVISLVDNTLVIVGTLTIFENTIRPILVFETFA